jgi:hypothetical protein
MDTTGAVLPPLVVEVRDARGRPETGLAVQFTSTGGPHPEIPALYLRSDYTNPQSTQPAGRFATTFTSADGRAEVQVAMGAYPGPASVIVSVPGRALVDTAHFEVLAAAGP